MADTRPHITIGHHAQYGVVAATSHDNHVAEHVLGLVGFERLPDSDLYALTDPHHDLVRRGGQAVQSLRAAQYNVSSDAAYDLQPQTRLSQTSGLLDRLEKTPSAAPSIPETAAAAAPTHAIIQAGRIVTHDQGHSPEGTLRTVSSNTRTRGGVLLHSEDDLRYVESRLPSTDVAVSYIRGNGRPESGPVTEQRRAQAATSISPARAAKAPSEGHPALIPHGQGRAATPTHTASDKKSRTR
ncbi:hypothetical protein [Streptomyces sp. NPDC050264]|uniref:hypothetical protein n=1 Tax=Streptomyces sp. NPDC050264 TaxID=3155038 RepID=UPI0034274A9B